jgi:hypothetical protein
MNNCGIFSVGTSKYITTYSFKSELHLQSLVRKDKSLITSRLSTIGYLWSKSGNYCDLLYILFVSNVRAYSIHSDS